MILISKEVNLVCVLDKRWFYSNPVLPDASPIKEGWRTPGLGNMEILEYLPTLPGTQFNPEICNCNWSY